MIVKSQRRLVGEWKKLEIQRPEYGRGLSDVAMTDGSPADWP